MPTRAASVLLDSILDYAGLFPPAKLAMAAAVESYARDRAGPDAWMLGRFVCPASRLEEFSAAAAPLLPGTHATSGYREHAAGRAGEPWMLSVLTDSVTDADPAGGLRRDLDRIAAFNTRHAHEDLGLATIDTIEVRPPTPDLVDQVWDEIPDDLFPFFEIPSQGDARGFIAALPGHGAAAKIRTGGVTADAFPTPERVALFIDACRLADIPFKATAGLHHALRGEYPLTYEKNAPRGAMFGFLNVFAAAALAHARRLDIAALTDCLTECEPRAFTLTDDGLSWRRQTMDTTQIARAREMFSVSFGSCSFDEPAGELRALGLI
jgi:hypothetical protein